MVTLSVGAFAVAVTAGAAGAIVTVSVGAFAVAVASAAAVATVTVSDGVAATVVASATGALMRTSPPPPAATVGTHSGAVRRCGGRRKTNTVRPQPTKRRMTP